MNRTPEEWVEKICEGNRRAVAQAISAVERRDPCCVALMKALFYKAGHSYIVGITGAPGAGKSTLLEKLAAEYRRHGNPVGIIAVDPSSPFSGGALLGDRIRMQSLATDEGAYIRSMASRGRLGGLAPAAQDAAVILDAAGCGVVFVETVGVGQDEVEIAQMADATVVLVVPAAGDEVQAFKAGLMEIADLFVINKADSSGAEIVERHLHRLLSAAQRSGDWQPGIIKTTATTGDGIQELYEELQKFRTDVLEGSLGRVRRREKIRFALLTLLRDSLLEKVARKQFDENRIAKYVDEILERRRDPHSIVEEMAQVSGVS